MEEEASKSLIIEQDNKNYLLVMKFQKEKLNLNLSVQEEVGSRFTKNMTIKEIKEINNCFLGLNSCNEFVDILKNLQERKKISIIKKDDKLIINLNIEYFFKNHSIEIPLSPEKRNDDEIIKDLCKELNSLKSENKELRKIIETLMKEIKEIKKIVEPLDKKFNKSAIMKENEFDFIRRELKNSLNKEVKELKKLYQARIDGDEAYKFHPRYNNIPNTLVIIESAGNRRFGGFTTKTWQSTPQSQMLDDKNSFLFSLDKQKIYHYKNNNFAIENYRDYGPKFGLGHDIYIKSKCIQEKNSYTNESTPNASYNYYGDKNALSEDGSGNSFYVADYEVFQVIFA